jgi:hypothetical protein
VKAKRFRDIKKSLIEKRAVISIWEANKCISIEELAERANVAPSRAGVIVAMHLRDEKEAAFPSQDKEAWAVLKFIALPASLISLAVIAALFLINIVLFVLGNI